MYWSIVFPAGLGGTWRWEGILIRKSSSPSFDSLFTYTPELSEIKVKWTSLALAAKIGASLIKSIP